MNKINLMYQVPIREQGFVNGDFIIQGTAINAVVTSNNHKFLAEELKESAGSLKGVPLLVDHDNSVSAIKGRVLSGTFNEVEEKVDFRAKIMDEAIKDLIKDGRLDTVSVGAVVENIEEEDGFFIPRGITFKELSLVAVPADSGATFQVALREAYNLKSENHIKLNEQEVKQMSEEKETETPKVESEPEVETKTEEPKEEVAEPVAEPEVTEEKVKGWLLEALKAVKASDEDEKTAEPAEVKVAKEEPKEETEEEEETEEVDEKYNIVRSSHNSFTLVR